MPQDNKYPNKIVRGASEINDAIFDYLKPKIKGKWLDVGCNVGVLLLEIPNGTGIDAGLDVLEEARKSGLDVIHADACNIPFDDNTFDTVLFSCTLEQVSLWQNAVDEGLRVCKAGGKVVGASPYPEMSVWGRVGGTEWVQSVIDPEDLKSGYKALIKSINPTHYYFEIRKI